MRAHFVTSIKNHSTTDIRLCLIPHGQQQSQTKLPSKVPPKFARQNSGIIAIARVHNGWPAISVQLKTKFLAEQCAA